MSPPWCTPAFARLLDPALACRCCCQGGIKIMPTPAPLLALTLPARPALRRAALADPDPEASAAAEADAFFCFVDLMGEFRDHFCQQLVRVLTAAGVGAGVGVARGHWRSAVSDAAAATGRAVAVLTRSVDAADTHSLSEHTQQACASCPPTHPPTHPPTCHAGQQHSGHPRHAGAPQPGS